MKARRRGYRQRRAAPPGPGYPLTNLTQLMSQPASEPALAPASGLRRLPRRYLALGLIIVAIVLLGALVVVRDISGPGSTSTVETFNPASSSLVSSLASVPSSVYDTVGVTSPTIPVTPLVAAGHNAPVWLASVNGGHLPVVFFYGAEFAPYAAAERWPLILALSRFGTFNQLGLMQSTSTTAFADVSTFTFWKASYVSHHVDLQSVERYSAAPQPDGGAVPRPPDPRPAQSAAIASYGTSATTFPLLDVANRYVLDGSGFSPAVLAGVSQDQIAGFLSSPAAPLTQAVIAAANEITAAICSVDGNKPDAVCESRGRAGGGRGAEDLTPAH